MKRATCEYIRTENGEIISIHALVKRATRFIVYIIMCLCISIHALVKRATRIVICMIPSIAISIHALVKRATVTFKSSRGDPSDFNPRPREEGDKQGL